MTTKLLEESLKNEKLAKNWKLFESLGNTIFEYLSEIKQTASELWVILSIAFRSW